MSEATPKRKRSPWYALYPDDFDGGTSDMSLAAVGAFQRLLNHQFARKCVPKCDGKICRIIRALPSEWDQIKDEVLPKFDETPDGNLINQRMEKERLEREGIREKRIEAGRIGNEKRWEKDRISAPICDPKGSNLGIASTATATVLSTSPKNQNGSDEPSFPMSVTYDSPMTESKTDEGRKEATSEPKSFGDGWQKEPVFLKLAAGLNVPESYAKRVFADLEAVGFVSGNGQRIVSPGAFLSELWKRDQNKTDRQENGKRQTWQIEQDLKRVKAEIAKITGDKSLRMAAMGHTEPWEAYKLRLGSEWLKVVAECYEAAETELPADVAKFKDWFAEHCREMQKDGVPADMLNADEYRLTKFQEFMPDADVPTFDRWDREWNAKSWIDPNALVPDARAEVDLLKQSERRLEVERKESLI